MRRFAANLNAPRTPPASLSQPRLSARTGSERQLCEEPSYDREVPGGNSEEKCGHSLEICLSFRSRQRFPGWEPRRGLSGGREVCELERLALVGLRVRGRPSAPVVRGSAIWDCCRGVQRRSRMSRFPMTPAQHCARPGVDVSPTRWGVGAPGGVIAIA